MLCYIRLMAGDSRSQDDDTKDLDCRSVRLYLLLSFNTGLKTIRCTQRHKDVIVEQRQKRFESVVKVVNPFVISELARPYV